MLKKFACYLQKLGAVLIKLFESEIRYMLKLQIGQIIWSLSIMASYIYVRSCTLNHTMTEKMPVNEIDLGLRKFFKHRLMNF